MSAMQVKMFLEWSNILSEKLVFVKIKLYVKIISSNDWTNHLTKNNSFPILWIFQL